MLQSQTWKEASQISKITKGRFRFGNLQLEFEFNQVVMLDIVPVDNHMTFNINTFSNQHQRFETHHQCSPILISRAMEI